MVSHDRQQAAGTSGKDEALIRRYRWAEAFEVLGRASYYCCSEAAAASGRKAIWPTSSQARSQSGVLAGTGRQTNAQLAPSQCRGFSLHRSKALSAR